MGYEVDKIMAVVGEKIVLKSDVQERIEQMLESKMTLNEKSRCQVMEDLVLQKMLVHQAELDSIEVPEGQILGEIDRRLNFFISQFGSEQKLEEFYGKSILDLREEFFEPVKEQMLVQQMQGTLTSKVKLSPSEVKEFYNNIPKDSLPYINLQVEIAQIVRKPKPSQEEIDKAIKKLTDIKERVENGEDFGTLAFLYSEDPGSARENGELGFMTRGMLVPEFSAVAFNLEIDQISDVVKTEYGYHLIQAIERRGQEMNFRHILIIPKLRTTDMIKAKNYLDSLSIEISKADSLEFGKFAELHSDDEETKNFGGVLVNPMDNSTFFEMDQLSQIDPSVVFTIDNLKKGEISEPVIMQSRDGRAYRIIKLINLIEPHALNLEQDYQRVSVVAEGEKEERVLGEWVVNKASKNYIRIDESFHTCKFVSDWGIVIQ